MDGLKEETQKCVFIYAAAAELWVGTWCQDVPGETAPTPPRPAKRGHSRSQIACVLVTVGNAAASRTSEETISRRCAGPGGDMGRQTGRAGGVFVFGSASVTPPLMRPGEEREHEETRLCKQCRW